MQLVLQNFYTPKTCISGGCKSEDIHTLSNVWLENGYHFHVSPVGITQKSSKGQPILSDFFYTLMNVIILIYLR